jgi:hypothetical protein
VSVHLQRPFVYDIDQLRQHEKGQACHQDHEHVEVHIGDYSPTELVVDIDEDEVLHETTSM